jgi:hypothetical protein
VRGGGATWRGVGAAAVLARARRRAAVRAWWHGGARATGVTAADGAGVRDAHLIRVESHPSSHARRR